MDKLVNLFLISILFLLFAGCTEENIQSESLYSEDGVSLKSTKAKHFVPFKATFEVYVDEVTHIPPPLPKEQIVLGVGNATHLGKTEVYIYQSWFPPHAPPLIPPWSGSGFGEFIFTAANGDVLLADYDDAIGYHESETLVYVTLTGIFKDGGTGRFENAEGFFNWEGIYNPITNIGTLTCTGEIKY